MSEKDSLNKKYQQLRAILTTKKVFYFLFIGGTFLTIWCSNYPLFLVLYISTICLYFIATSVFELMNYYLEKLRIVNAIEVGFARKIDSNVETVNYYNNNLQSGLDKFCLNIFESVFFTRKIYGKDVILKYISYAIFIAAFISSLAISTSNIAYIICEIVFSCGIAYDIYKSVVFHIEINSLFNHFDKVYHSKKISKQKELLLACTYQYEKLKSYISLSLNSRTFKNMNEKLAHEWNTYLEKNIDK